jgi:O-acetylserine/cysteine efflux transporter
LRHRLAASMRGRDMALAIATSIIWGFAFPAIKLGLADFSPAQLTALRFIIAALPVFFVRCPRIGWRAILLIGLTLFTGQFLLMFFAYQLGLPPGLASVTQQIQVFFTVLLAAIFLGDIPSGRQILGMAVAFAGLAVVALTVGGDLSLAALALALGAAFSWSIGNTLVKRQHAAPIFALMAWCSLVPPLPSLAVSAVLDRETLWNALGHAGWPAIAAAIYLGTVTTNIGFAAWGSLLQRYKAGAVAPFALLAPCTGILSSAALFGEVFPAARYAGMALIMAGLAVILLPGGKPPPTVEPVA